MEPAPIWYGRVVPNFILLLKNANQILTNIRTMPRIFLSEYSCIPLSIQIDIVDVTRNTDSIGRSLFQVILLRYLYAAIIDVVRARSPDRAVASPYEGIRKGRCVIMKMPNPKPVVRCTKLAPVASRNISRIFSINSICRDKDSDFYRGYY